MYIYSTHVYMLVSVGLGASANEFPNDLATIGRVKNVKQLGPMHSYDRVCCYTVSLNIQYAPYLEYLACTFTA